MTRKSFLSSVGLLFAVSIVFFLIHFFIVKGLGDSFQFYYPVWTIYTFHFIVTTLIFFMIYLVGKFMPSYIGFTFMASILFKMAVALIFLLPLIKMKNVSKIPDFTSFFLPYFIYLFLEIILAMRILKEAENQFKR